jgi:hypothetical protein
MPNSARQGATLATDAAQAVADLAEQIGGPDLDVIFMFCSPVYDLKRVAERLRATCYESRKMRASCSRSVRVA